MQVAPEDEHDDVSLPEQAPAVGSHVLLSVLQVHPVTPWQRVLVPCDVHVDVHPPPQLQPALVHALPVSPEHVPLLAPEQPFPPDGPASKRQLAALQAAPPSFWRAVKQVADEGPTQPLPVELPPSNVHAPLHDACVAVVVVGQLAVSAHEPVQEQEGFPEPE